MAGTRNQVEGLPWYRAAIAGGTGVDVDAMDQIDTDSLVDRARCVVTGTPANAVYEYSQDSAAAADGFNVVAPSSGVGRWILVSIGGSQPFITQSTWYVDSVSGDDDNDGATALTAIKTLAELTRRTEGRVLLPSISLFAVHLSGTFPTEPLSLNFSVGAYCWVQITADTQVDYAGTISGFTTYSAGVTAALLDDAGAAFAAGDVGKRLRLTSGASLGAVTFILKQISGTQVRVGDFYHYNAASGYGVPALTATPANGTTFVVEDLLCQVAGCDVVIDGGHAALLIDGVEFVKPPSPITRTTLRCWANALTVASKLFGCRMNTTGSNMNLNNSVATVVSCLWRGNGAPIIQDGSVQAYGMLLMAPLSVVGNGSLTVISLYQQGGGDSVVATIGRNGFMSVSGNWAVYDATGDANLVVDDNAAVVSTSATAYWGIGAATSYGIRCRGMGRFSYTTKPTVSGSINDTIIGGTATAWGAVPFINPANNCAITLRA